MIPTIIKIFGWSMLLFFNSMIIHELGHWLYFKLILKKDVDITFYRDETKKEHICRIGHAVDYCGLSNHNRYGIYAAGIFLGLVPLTFASIYNIIYIALIPFYFWGCNADFKNIWRLIRQ